MYGHGKAFLYPCQIPFHSSFQFPIYSLPDSVRKNKGAAHLIFYILKIFLTLEIAGQIGPLLLQYLPVKVTVSLVVFQ